MDFSNIFQPITYNSNVNGFLADYNMRFMDPIGPIYNFGGGNSTNWNGGSSSIWSGYLDNNSGWNSFDSGYIVGNPFSNLVIPRLISDRFIILAVLQTMTQVRLLRLQLQHRQQKRHNLIRQSQLKHHNPAIT